jgi:transketolase
MSSIQERIISISKKHGLSHNGGNLTCASIIEEIYSIKKEDEPFVLSCGHNSLSLFCVLEKMYGFDAEQLYLKHGTHPNRDMEHKIWCSTGSLGMGIGISCGMALANRNRDVYVLISDGEAFEGICWEISNVIRKYNITNLKIYFNFNGFGAFDEIDTKFGERVIDLFYPNINLRVTRFEDYGLSGQSAHYCKL